MAYNVGNPASGLGQVQKWGWVKPVNGIPIPYLLHSLQLPCLLLQLKKFYEFEVTLEEMAYLADFLPQDACTNSNFTMSTTLPMNTTTTRNPIHDGNEEQADLMDEGKGKHKGNVDPVKFNFLLYFSCSSFFSHEQHRKIQFYFKQSRFRYK